MRIAIVFLIGIACCMATSNFEGLELGKTRVADLFTCVKDLKKSSNLLPDISAAIKLKLYNKAIQDLQSLIVLVNTAIENCAEGTCWQQGQQRCENKEDTQCEKWGLLWYPKCREGYHNDACCICSSKKQKPHTYGRGAGFSEGKCISENWSDYTPIEKYGECTSMAEQIAIDIDLVLESIDDKDRKIVTIRRAYVLLQHASPFIQHCEDVLQTKVTPSFE